MPHLKSVKNRKPNLIMPKDRKPKIKMAKNRKPPAYTPPPFFWVFYPKYAYKRYAECYTVSKNVHFYIIILNIKWVIAF